MSIEENDTPSEFKAAAEFVPAAVSNGDASPPTSEQKRTRKPRRTKSQMLADAASRPDTGRPTILVDLEQERILPAVSVDLVKIDARLARFDYMSSTIATAERLAVVACMLALVALSVAIGALAR